MTGRPLIHDLWWIMPRSLTDRLTRFVRLRAAARHDTVTRDWLVVTGGSFSRLALGFIASIIIARSLGPSAFGVYAVLATSAAITGAIGDFGLTNAAVRRIVAARQREPQRAAQIWSTFFWARLLAVAGVVTLGILFAAPISRYIIGLPQESNLLRLALIGVAATALSGTVTALLQATGHFGRLAAVMLANAALTVMLAAALAQTHQLTLYTALVVLGIGTSIVSFIFGYRLLPGAWPLNLPDRETFRHDGVDLARFGAWLWIGGILSVMAAHIDLLLVNHWTLPATVGAYSLAVSLATRVEVVNHSLYTVLLVSASRIDTPAGIRHYVRSGLLRSAIICLALVPLILLAGPFIGTFYGAAFEPAVRLFQSLILVTILNILLTPLLMLAFTLDQPRLIAVTDSARVVTLLGAGIILVPAFGVSGAIAAKLVAALAGGVILAGLLHRERRSLEKSVVEIA